MGWGCGLWSPSVALIGHYCTCGTCDGVRVGVGAMVTRLLLVVHCCT